MTVYAGDNKLDEAAVTKFVGQAEPFLEAALKELGIRRLEDVPSVTRKPASPLRPVFLRDFRHLTGDEISSLKAAYYGPDGVAYFIVINCHDEPQLGHPLIDITSQLRNELNLRHQINHPMEGHKEAVSRWGPPDGTLKLYDLTARDGTGGYREQAETAEMFAAHNDGLGYGGVVQTAVFYLDAAPLWGGFTYFQNGLALAVELARKDYPAYQALFLPDAITAIRPRGKGAIKVTCPVLYLNEDSKPQLFFRVSSGEYAISWRQDPPLLRAMEFLNEYTQPFSGGSTFVHFASRGHGTILRNGIVLHGRTPFLDGVEPNQRRCLARKWFATAAKHTGYKHVPGLHLAPEFAAIFPERFGPEVLEGDWNYDSTQDLNIRIH